MNTLIIYATKNGSVKEVAQLIKRELVGKVKLVNAHDEIIKDVTEFDNIMIGSSIYFGQIDRKIKNFIFLNRPEILKKKFGFFIMAVEPNKEMLIKQVHNALSNDLIDKAETISVIGSQIKLKKFSWIVRIILRYFRNIKCSYKDIDKEKISEFVKKFQD